MHRRPQKDYAQEWIRSLTPSARPLKAARLTRSPRVTRLVTGSLMIVAFLIVLQLVQIQIYDGARYKSLANGNRLRERISYAPRGRILDRNGAVLAENIVTTQLVVYPYLLNEDPVKRQESISQIAVATNKSVDELSGQINSYVKTDIQAHVVVGNLDQPTIIKLEELMTSTDGFALEDIPSRKYDASAGLSHILGYTGYVSQEDLDSERKTVLIPTDTIGRAGVEATFDDELRGVNGIEKVEVDALGRPVSILARQSAKNGSDIKLTIDITLQKALAESIRKQMEASKVSKGNGVIVDPRNGEVLAMVSAPYFDNNEFSGGISKQRYDELINDPLQPMINQTISGGYPTGSIIKPLVASAALQEKIVTPSTTVVDRGFIEVPSIYDPAVRYRFVGWNPAGLGTLDVRRALSLSSNIYFYTVGGGFESQPGLGVQRLTDYYSAFGLGEKTGIRLPYELSGRVPTPAWKREAKNEEWFVGDTYNISIGQGDMLISPLQITMAEIAIANNGRLLRPKIVMSEKVEVRRQLPIDSRHLQVVREGMRQAITDGATIPRVFTGSTQVAGKSGTAETNSPGGKPPHAWFTAFAPYENPELLATVLIEEAKEGGRYASPVVAEVFNGYFSGRQP